MEGPGNEKWLVGQSRLELKKTLAAPVYQERLHRGTWEASICYQILVFAKDAEANGWKPSESMQEAPTSDELDELEEEERQGTIRDWIDLYGEVTKFFVDKLQTGVQQVDAREWFKAKMTEKEEAIKADSNGAGGEA